MTAPVPAPVPVLLDTDVGTNPDDAVALAVLLGSPQVRLVACTTVDGDTQARAKVAAGLLGAAGHEVPCVAGVRSSREGGFDDGAGAVRLADAFTRAAVRAGMPFDVVAIGPLTNLARGLRSGTLGPRSVRRLWIMGGRYDAGAEAEHNFAVDPAAADAVLSAGLPTTVVGLEVTRRVRLSADDIAQIAGFGTLGAELARMVREWDRFRREGHLVPNDALAVLALVAPRQFAFRPASVSVTTAGPAAGRCRVGSGDAVRIVSDCDVDGVRAQILDRLASAGR